MKATPGLVTARRPSSSISARKRAERLFSRDQIVDQYERIYRQAMEGPQR